jgi:GTP pyrophosphokinase
MTDFLIRVAQFAAKAHEGQKRTSGRPYIEHPMRVAGRVMLWPDVDKGGIGEQIVAAAWCHDVLEDTKVTVEELGQFGPVVTAIVIDLTKPPLSAGNRATRQELFRQQLKKASHEAQVIKLIDRIDNLSDVNPDFDDASWANLYARESILLADVIGFAHPALNEDLRGLAAQFLVR